MKKVVLKPCELHTVDANGFVCLYAGLWDITSSDAETHDYFCNVASYYKVFCFYNAGRYADKNKPYTFDDGVNSLRWLSSLYRVINYCKKDKNIDVIIELSKDFNKKYGVQKGYDNNFYSTKVQDRLIDTYFKIIRDAFDGHIITRCKDFNFYPYQFINDRVCIKID